MPRPRQYENNAEKQKAYRERLKERIVAEENRVDTPQQAAALLPAHAVTKSEGAGDPSATKLDQFLGR